MYIGLVNETCGTFHELRELSIFTGASAGLFGILIVLVNFPILFCIIRAVRRHEKKFQHFFYKLLICITLSDSLKGLLAAPATVSFCIHELHHENSNQDLDGLILHLTLLIPDAAALVTMTYLSFDRLLPLYFPNKYVFGFRKKERKIVLWCIWPIAIIITIPYCLINYIKELLIYGGIAITVTLTSLILLIVSFHRKTVQKKAAENGINLDKSIRSNLTETKNLLSCCSKGSVKDGLITKLRSLTSAEDTPADESFHKKERSASSTTMNSTVSQPRDESIERRITNTFMKMLLVFLATYLPIVFFILYMNISSISHVNCVVRHVMRDLTVIFILASSFFRGLNFLLTLKTVKGAVLKTFICK